MSMSKIFCYHKGNGFFWFRLFGYGLALKNLSKHKMTFSERKGFTKCIVVNNWLIKLLSK